ncbi:hypothetical protein [Cellulomonas sp. WB94]|uniref:hypothetical protein n=1 Tax=Cellulomonas sp. WB94 TaxID=2173174 RepID=UPI001F5B69D3|nr:hypothetical protein [Cellulomonas sp. WB94]
MTSSNVAVPIVCPDGNEAVVSAPGMSMVASGGLGRPTRSLIASDSSVEATIAAARIPGRHHSRRTANHTAQATRTRTGRTRGPETSVIAANTARMVGPR